MVKTSVAALLLLALTAALVPAALGNDLEETVDGTLAVEQQTQEQREAWAEEKAELLARYRNAKVNVEYLDERLTVEGEKAAALQDRIDEFERRLDESSRLQGSLQDTLDVVMERLEGWVEGDLPFLVEERQARLSELRKELARPDVHGAEKLRRLLEALQVEVTYGGTVEVHQEKIRVAGEEIHADILRLGRVSAFWKTPDNARFGEYDRASAAWVELPSKYKRTLVTTYEMASRIRPVELVALPLGRIQP